MRIGFIGTGNMGRPMALRLLKAGFNLSVHDFRPDAARELLDAGAAWAESPADVARACNVICTSLPGPAEAESVVLGQHGICHTATPGTIYVDFTTNSPLLVRRMGDALAARGVSMLDAPVSGGVEGAAAGTLTILVGGDAEALARVRCVLEHLAQNIIPVGKIGSASIVKVLHNCAVFGTNLAMIEALTVGVRAGIDAATLVEVFQKSGLGRNLDLQVALPATLFRGNFRPRYAMKTAYKDMDIALELAREHGVSAHVAELCHADMKAAMERGWGDLDNTSFLKLQEERAGVEVRTESKSESTAPL